MTHTATHTAGTSTFLAVAMIPLLLGACGEPGSIPPSQEEGGTLFDSSDGPEATGGASGSSGSSSEGSTEVDPETTEGSSTTASHEPSNPEDFMTALAGLWTGPVTSQTSAGNFPTMNMDVRPADDRTLFARCDIDGANSIRFAFSMETHDGEDVLVFRNGGYFLGILRDTRTRLVDHDPQAGRWQFCSISRGCDYVDARFTLTGTDRLALDVQVHSMFHIHWGGTRVEARPLEGPFPYDATPNVADVPFPDMPSLVGTVSWNGPAEGDEEVWMVLTTEPCGISMQGCTPSRAIRTRVEPGATQATVTIDQLHAGSYYALAILDRNGNLPQTMIPDRGDGISLPDQPVTVPPEGTSDIEVAIAFNLP